MNTSKLRWHRPLGQTGMTVSPIGLGTVKFGRNQNVHYPASFALPSDHDIMHLLHTAKQLNINLIDTAPAYGTSEQRLGLCIKKMGDRAHWIISSKLGEYFKDGRSIFDFSKKAAERSVDASLRRLQTDYLDIMLVHSNGDDLKIIHDDAIFETLIKLKESGKIRAFGMSSKTVAGGLLAVEQSDIVMVTYNLLDTEQQAVIAHAHQLGKGVFIKKALASGHISQHQQLPSPIAASIRFIMHQPGVSSIVIGTLNTHHLEEIVNDAKASILASAFRS